ncbi:hypothetical protein QYF36_020288 [Acer negundo]|nr:hypothetical protein QYF36_020288 [Acer negundo]
MVATDLSSQSKGYGYLLFDNEEFSTSEIDKLNGTPLKGKQLYVGLYLRNYVVMRDADGKSKGFGFVNFEDPDDAAYAVKALNGYKFDNKEWYVGKAQKK